MPPPTPGLRGSRWSRLLVLLALAMGLSACEGVIGGRTEDDGDLPPGSRPGDPGGDDPAIDVLDSAGVLGGGEARGIDVSPDAVAPTARLHRLTHRQWQNAIAQLFLLPEDAPDFGAELRDDAPVAGFLFDNDGASLSVDEALFLGYQRAAVRIAEYVTSDPALFSALLPESAEGDAARAESFIRSFGARAHGRPLSDAMVADYMAVYEAGRTLYGSEDRFEFGIRLFFEAILQSPHFLYRIEESGGAGDDPASLDDYDVASRLSFFLWDSPPDEALLSAAAAGELSSEADVSSHARRMLDDPRAEETLVCFHQQLLDVDDFEAIAPSDAVYPDAPSNLGELAAIENELFLKDQIFEAGAGFADLLLAEETFVNDALASIYGLEGSFDERFVRVQLDPTERRGIFTQIGFLASNANSVNPDPIHRGVFLATRIACMGIPAPPDGVPPLPASEGRTNRETVSAHTEDPESVCVACHGLVINPLGFPFESYDAIGAFRTEDSGFPVDTSGRPFVGGSRYAVEDGLELATVLAESPEVHDCYVAHFIERAHGRPLSPEDHGLVRELSDASRAGELSVRELAVAVATSTAFRSRVSMEGP